VRRLNLSVSQGTLVLHAHLAFDFGEAGIGTQQRVARKNPNQPCGADFNEFVDPREGLVLVAQPDVEGGDVKRVRVPMILLPARQRRLQILLQNPAEEARRQPTKSQKDWEEGWWT